MSAVARMSSSARSNSAKRSTLLLFFFFFVNCLRYAPEKVCQIIMACAVLHNKANAQRLRLPDGECTDDCNHDDQDDYLDDGNDNDSDSDDDVDDDELSVMT